MENQGTEEGGGVQLRWSCWLQCAVDSMLCRVPGCSEYCSEQLLFVQPPSHVWFSATPWTAAHQASCSSLSPWVCLNSYPWSQWYYPTMSSSVVPFSSCLQSFLASGSFPMSHLFRSGGPSIGVSASVLPVNIQGWFPLGLTSLISLQSKGLSRIFSSTTVQKHPFFSAQPSLWSSSHIHTWLLEKT